MDTNDVEDVPTYIHFNEDVIFTKVLAMASPCIPDEVRKSIVMDLVGTKDSLMPPRNQGKACKGADLSDGEGGGGKVAMLQSERKTTSK